YESVCKPTFFNGDQRSCGGALGNWAGVATNGRTEGPTGARLRRGSMRIHGAFSVPSSRPAKKNGKALNIPFISRSKLQKPSTRASPAIRPRASRVTRDAEERSALNSGQRN